MLRALFVASSLVVGLVPVSARAGDDWSRQRIAQHPISVELPGSASAEHSTSNWYLGKAETDSVRVEEEGIKLQANATVAPLTAIKIAGRDLIFYTTRETILGQSGGKVQSWTEVTRDGMEGKRLVYSVDDTHKGMMEVYVFDSTILTLDAVFPASTPERKVDRFFASMRRAQ
ncbi:MAG: hypothetical protein H6733_15670 [Alphaproteobacteria bacterium]|nr:hypothetical protein [Alphaproteobacteria bacterium]